ncbi:hypothetical protein IBA8401_04120 [Pseudomonas syringae]
MSVTWAVKLEADAFAADAIHSPATNAEINTLVMPDSTHTGSAVNEVSPSLSALTGPLINNGFPTALQTIDQDY